LEINILTLDGCERCAEITVTKAELEPHFEKAFLEAQPEIEMKGFRKGKVPVRLIKQMFGNAIRQETINELSNEMFFQAVKDNNIKFIGKPQLKNIDVNDDGVKYEVVYDVMPEFELKDYRALTIDEPIHNVTEEEKEEYIYSVRASHGSVEEDTVVRNDKYIVKVNIRETIDNTGIVSLDSKSNEQYIYMMRKDIPNSIKESIMDKNVGDTFHYNPHSDDPKQPDKALQFEITQIQKILPIELTPEFVSDYTGGKITTIEDFKDDIGFTMQERWNEKSRQAMERQIVQKMVELHQIEVPHSVVKDAADDNFKSDMKKYKDAQLPKDLKDQLYQAYYKGAEGQVAWEIIKQRIIEKEDLKVEDYDIDAFAEMQAKQLNADPEFIKSRLLEQEDENYKHYILNKKVFDLILDFAITNEVPFEDEKVQEYVDDSDDYDEDYDDEDDADVFYDDDEEEHEHHHDHDHDHGHEHHHH
jgi:trigger factor